VSGRYRNGMIVGKFYPPHAGHHELIDRALTACDRLTVIVAPSRRESIPLDLRVAWLRAEHPGVDVVGVYDDNPIDYDDPDVWEAHCAVFREALDGRPVDVVFSSEGYGDELARRFHATHVCVDPERMRVPVSGTAVRADPVAYWGLLRMSVRAWFTRTVIVVGAESTGTTTMARALAAHYGARGGTWEKTRWVPEYGRELTEHKLAMLRSFRPDAAVGDVAWTRQDFLDVARMQNAIEDWAALDGSPVLFGDTDALATCVWEERYLGSTSAEVREVVRPPDLYLLTGLDGVPFEDDGLRDGAHVREWMTRRLREETLASGVPVVELDGAHPERLAVAVAAVGSPPAPGVRLDPSACGLPQPFAWLGLPR
jgi:HTH-type transcriptional repressor of NAD biosynthesis genes